MQITVKLFATLRDNREKIMTMDVAEGMTTQGVIEAVGIPVEEVAIIMINGRGVKLETILHEEDVLALFPPVGGG